MTFQVSYTSQPTHQTTNQPAYQPTNQPIQQSAYSAAMDFYQSSTISKGPQLDQPTHQPTN